MTGPFPSVFDQAHGKREEFVELARQSGRLLNERSHAQIIGAENLLTKAIRALAAGDAERAEQLIQRAAQSPYDAREEGSPGVRAASLLVYRRISDQFEASEYDDATWLDVVLKVHSGLDPLGRAEVERCRVGAGNWTASATRAASARGGGPRPDRSCAASSAQPTAADKPRSLRRVVAGRLQGWRPPGAASPIRVNGPDRDSSDPRRKRCRPEASSIGDAWTPGQMVL